MITWKYEIGLLIVIYSLLSSFTGVSLANQEIQNSIVKIYTTQSNPDYANPWNTSSPQQISGTGSVIKNNLILTNAHVVSNQTFIQVQSHGRPNRYGAKVVAVSHETDLALLKAEDESFYKDIMPLKLGELPDMQQEVIVYGFPVGGDTLSTTKGVISRVEYQTFAHSGHQFLTAQIDAAINFGNSGGPAMTEDRIVGVVMQSLSDSENIGYIVPTPIIKHFLVDLEDGQYDGFPEDGTMIQTMENPGLKKMAGLRDGQAGVLIYAVLPGSPAEGKIFPGDVVLSIDGHEIADDGTISLGSSKRIDSNYIVQMHQMGDCLRMEILQDGEVKQVDLKLTTAVGHYDLVYNDQYDKPPAYFIYGGLVFIPLSTNYLKTWGKYWREESPPYLMSKRYDLPQKEGEEVVVLLTVLPSEVNIGYHEIEDYIITAVNGQEIHNLKELINEVEKGKDKPFVSFTEKDGVMIVLDCKKAEWEHEDILRAYNVPSN